MGIERLIVPAVIQDWYDGLDYWPRNFVNWVVIHGGIIAVIILVCALFGIPWWGYFGGAGFYIVKETAAWLLGGSKYPSVDQIGDALGPVIVGLVVVLLVT